MIFQPNNLHGRYYCIISITGTNSDSNRFARSKSLEDNETSQFLYKRALTPSQAIHNLKDPKPNYEAKMKFQSIILSLTVGLSSVIYAQSNWQRRRRMLWFGGDNPVKAVNVSTPGTTYTFFSGVDCTGNPIGSGKDNQTFPQPIQFTNSQNQVQGPLSVFETCPSGNNQ
ncbi:5043_t:CDS:2 [Ambispora leptoticha]|uniref:5043_t:CDS:1 n=1 Tax=Ambispora leptoticha TaxID=144679 RepID=A0A9N8V872_9GLOM|nr:5043_t:CDS:2 [Ambispora leptoticha]